MIREPSKHVLTMRQCIFCQHTSVVEILEGHQVFYHCYSCRRKAPYTFEDDGMAKLERNRTGNYRHYSVYVLAIKDGKYLITKRRRFPFVYHLIAGHINRDETPEEAARREIVKGTSATFGSLRMVSRGEFRYICRMRVTNHRYYFFRCTLHGPIIPSDEIEEYHLVSRPEIRSLQPMSTAVQTLLRKAGVLA